MGMFDGIERVSSTKSGQWILPGLHTFKVGAVKTPDNLRSGNVFIAELEVVESTCETYTVGQSVSFVKKIGGEWADLALADIKAFIAAATGAAEEEVTAADIEGIVSDNSMVAGNLIKCDAHETDTKKGTKFTKTNWATA